jgi:hypothetical protein
VGWTAGVGFLAESKIFLCPIRSSPALEPTQPPIQCAFRAVSPEVKLQEREANHSPPFGDENKNGGAIPPLPHMFSWRDA